MGDRVVQFACDAVAFAFDCGQLEFAAQLSLADHSSETVDHHLHHRLSLVPRSAGTEIESELPERRRAVSQWRGDHAPGCVGGCSDREAASDEPVGGFDRDPRAVRVGHGDELAQHRGDLVREVVGTCGDRADVRDPIEIAHPSSELGGSLLDASLEELAAEDDFVFGSARGAGEMQRHRGDEDQQSER